MQRLQSWDLPRHPLTLRLLTCDRVRLDASWAYHLHSPFWRLYFHSENGAEITFAGGRHRLTKGTWHILPAWLDYRARCHAPTSQRFCHFTIAELGPAWCTQYAAKPVTLPANAAIDQLGAALEENQVVSTKHLLAQSLVITAFAGFLATVAPAGQDAVATLLNDRGPLAPARRYLEERLHNPPSIGELATLCGYSDDHFARLVRQAEGCSPRRWIERERVTLAAERLAHGDDSIEQIADDLGYADRFHFSKAFRRVMGSPPARWRTAQRGAS